MVLVFDEINNEVLGYETSQKCGHEINNNVAGFSIMTSYGRKLL